MSQIAGPQTKQFKLVDWDKVETLTDLKLVLQAMCGELGFSPENIFYSILDKKGLLGEMKEVAQDVPPDKPGG